MNKDQPDSYYDELVNNMNPQLAKGMEPYDFAEFITCQKLIRALIRLNNGEVCAGRIEVWFRKNAEEIALGMEDVILPMTEREWGLWYDQLERLLPGFIKSEEKKA